MTVRIAISDAATTQDLRRAVLRPSWPAGAAMHGDENADAVHVGAFDDDGTLLGTCLVLPRSYPPRPDEPHAWQLRGMATTPARQGQGIGARVLAAAVELVVERGGRLIWCDARTSARAFYAQHGFAAEGPEFEHAESGIPHYRMWRAVP